MTPAGEARETVHATCCVIGETGILIRGASGSGKSSLARDLVDEAVRSGGFARIVGDDRVRLARADGRVIARPHPEIAGLLEIRGLGLVRIDHEPACLVRLVVDLGAVPPARLPDAEETFTTVLGVRIPRLAVERRDAAALVSWRVRGSGDTPVTDR